jgi:hypothetical protein
VICTRSSQPVATNANIAAAANMSGIFHFDLEGDFEPRMLLVSVLPKLNLGKLQADIATTSDG